MPDAWLYIQIRRVRNGNDSLWLESRSTACNSTISICTRTRTDERMRHSSYRIMNNILKWLKRNSGYECEYSTIQFIGECVYCLFTSEHVQTDMMTSLAYKWNFWWRNHLIRLDNRIGRYTSHSPNRTYVIHRFLISYQTRPIKLVLWATPNRIEKLSDPFYLHSNLWFVQNPWHYSVSGSTVFTLSQRSIGTHWSNISRAKPGLQSQRSVQKFDWHSSDPRWCGLMCSQVCVSQFLAHRFSSLSLSLHSHGIAQFVSGTQIPQALRRKPSSQSQMFASHTIGHTSSFPRFGWMAFGHVLGVHGLKHSIIFSCSWQPTGGLMKRLVWTDLDRFTNISTY